MALFVLEISDVADLILLLRRNHVVAYDLLLSVDECVFYRRQRLMCLSDIMFMSYHVIACNIHCICHSM